MFSCGVRGFRCGVTRGIFNGALAVGILFQKIGQAGWFFVNARILRGRQERVDPKTGLTTPICRGSIHIRRLSWHLVSGKLLGALRRQRGFGLGGGLRGLFLDLICAGQAL